MFFKFYENLDLVLLSLLKLLAMLLYYEILLCYNLCDIIKKDMVAYI